MLLFYFSFNELVLHTPFISIFHYIIVLKSQHNLEKIKIYIESKMKEVYAQYLSKEFKRDGNNYYLII